MIGIKSIASYVPADGIDNYAQGAKFAKDEEFIIGKIGSAFLPRKEAAQEKAVSIAAKLREMKLLSAAKKVEDSVGETLTYMDFPTEHWSRIRTNNLTERVNREIRRRTRAIGAFPDGNSALMLVCARLRHVAASEWGSKRYMDMEHLFKMEIEQPNDEENPYI